MLRAAAQQLGRACGLPGAAQVGAGPASALRQAALGLTQSWLRCFSTDDAAGASGSSEGGAGDAPAPSSSTGRSSRPHTKEWRAWIDTKLDSKLEAMEEPVAAAPKPKGGKAGKAGKAAAPPATPAAKQARGFELEQQIYSIVAPARPAEEGTLPEGVTSYGQLAMASDAPRFLRASANLGDMSPQRLHPTRLFFPQQTYAPADLDPYKTSPTAAAGALAPGAGPRLGPDEVTRLADFKNAPLLASFLSEAGKLPLRKRTQLRAKLHRHLARQVKIARQLGILSATERWQPAAAEGGQQRRGGARQGGQQRQGGGPRQGGPRQQQQQQGNRQRQRAAAA